MSPKETKSSPSRLADLAGLAFWLLLTFGVAAFGSQFEPGDWYLTLTRPSWNPPGWVFGPVWGLLYLSMSIAAWLVWRRRSQKPVALPLGFYLTQLLLNGMWSWLFFGERLIGTALLDLVLIVLFVAITTRLFMKTHKTAGLLLVPYLLWVSFAAVLNFQIWRLN